MRRSVVIALSLASCGRVGFDAGDTALDAPLGGDCPVVGDICADGTIYAGLSPDGNVRMYTERVQSFFGPWSFGSGLPPAMAVEAGLVSRVTGEANTALIATGGPFEDADAGAAGVQPHEAANYCAELTSNGHDDWYLPASDEVEVLYTNRVAIGGFPSGELWSSSEDDISPIDCALAVDFGNGDIVHFRAKFDYRPVRCVRR